MRAALLLTLIGCMNVDPAEQVEGEFRGGITDDCRCDVDSHFEFQISCSGTNEPSLFIDAPQPNVPFSGGAMVLFSSQVNLSQYSGALTFENARYSDTVLTFDNSTSMFYGFTVAHALAADQYLCDPFNTVTCENVTGFEISNATFNCEVGPF